jgi:signal transduction histidine kinase
MSARSAPRSARDAAVRRTRAGRPSLLPAQGTFPVVVALDAIEAWQRDPTPARHGWVRDALAAVVRAAGAAGAYLEVDAPPLLPLAVGVGSLRRRPARGSPAIVEYQLCADEGRERLGRVWLDAAASDAAVNVRVLEIALDAAWSRVAVRATADRLEALDAATRAIAGVLDLDRVLQLIVDSARDLLGARYAALGIVGERGVIERFITGGVTAEERAAIGAPPRGRGLLGLIIREARSLRVADVSSHPDSFGFPPGHPVMRSLLGVPVFVKGRAIGRFYFCDKEVGGEFTADDERLAEMFSLHAGIAIDNARLHEQVQRLVVIEERERIGKDLHDGIIQSLYAVGLSLEDLPELMADDPLEATARVDRAIDALNLAIRDIRNFIFGLRPELLEGTDLAGSLAALADEFRLNTLIDLDLEVDEGHARDLPVEVRIELLQVAREALSNAARHARANHVRLSVSDDDGQLTLVVEDNGIGFDPDAPRPSTHQGLPNMRARAEIVGGELSIDSGPGAGTRIIVHVPLPAASEDRAQRA